MRQFWLDQLEINGTSWKAIQNFQPKYPNSKCVLTICNSSPVSSMQFQKATTLEVQSGNTYLQSLAVKLIRDAFDHFGFLLTICTTSVISYLPIIISGLSFSGSQEARRSDRTEMSSCEDGCKKGTMLDLLFRTLIHIIPKWEIHLRPSRHNFSTSCGPWQSFKPPLRPSQLFGTSAVTILLYM